MKHKLLLIGIVLCALILRTFGMNWDSNQHLHPDERFLTMVSASAQVPHSFQDYLDPTVSTLNPYNFGDFNFFVYGTFPLTINKLTAVVYGMDSYNGLVIMGRFLSAVSDVGTLIFVYLIAVVLEKHRRFHMWLKYVATFLYAIAVLPIQNSHFFTTDSFATFFVTAAVYCALQFFYESKVKYTVLSAILFGLALGTKISSVYVLPLIGLLFLFGLLSRISEHKRKVRDLPRKLLKLSIHGVIFVVVSYIALRVGDPKFFETGNILNVNINPQYLGNLRELLYLGSEDAVFPPSIQWLSKRSIITPLKDMIMFGLGIPYFIAMGAGVVVAIRKKYKELLLILLWMGGFFLYQGTQFVLTMRYFYVLYPFFAILAGIALTEAFKTRFREQWKVLFGAILLSILVWPMAFMTIYTRPHTYVQASEWIYENIPHQSVLIEEHWNDFLPLNLPENETGPARFAGIFTIRELPVFDPDSPAKISKLDAELRNAEYYVIANNRGYGSIMPARERYPLTAEFYEELLSGHKGYTKVAEFTSYPTVNFGFYAFEINDQWADEAFTVYDHPRVLIFKKKR